MPAKMSMRVRLSDPKSIQKKLVGDKLYGPGVEEIVNTAGRTVLANAKARAPGRIGQVIAFELERSRSKTGFGVLQGRVRVGNRTRRGFRYPWALQASKTRKFRHRSGNRKGKLTKAWFSGAKTGVNKELKAAVAALAETIKREWTR